MKTLKIEKAKEYVWRLSCFRQHSHHAWVEGWNVVDVETGAVVYGGFQPGSNVESGRAYVERKKDAAAFIAGHEAAKNNPFVVRRAGLGGLIVVDGANPFDVRGNTDDRARRAFESGAIAAARDARKAAV